MARAGTFIKQKTGYSAFLPSPLPPNPPIAQDDELTYLLGEATMAVGRLSGLSSIIPDPDLFVYLYVRKEALLSSQIEGTQCSLEDILNPEFEPLSDSSDPQEVEEVSNYVKAMNEGLSRLHTLPISTRLIKEMHKILMKGVRGANKTPGEFRRSQNWIGPPGATLMNAQFVPPPPEEVGQLMSDLKIHSCTRPYSSLLHQSLAHSCAI